MVFGLVVRLNTLFRIRCKCVSVFFHLESYFVYVDVLSMMLKIDKAFAWIKMMTSKWNVWMRCIFHILASFECFPVLSLCVYAFFEFYVTTTTIPIHMVHFKYASTQAINFYEVSDLPENQNVCLCVCVCSCATTHNCYVNTVLKSISTGWWDVLWIAAWKIPFSRKHAHTILWDRQYNSNGISSGLNLNRVNIIRA